MNKVERPTGGRPQGNMREELPVRMHHRAIVVRDQEETRLFMEDIIGMPLAATWCESIFKRRADAHSELARWLGGRRENNNDYRKRDF